MVRVNADTPEMIGVTPPPSRDLMLNILSVFLATLSSALRTRVALQVEILALRHQIGVL